MRYAMKGKPSAAADGPERNESPELTSTQELSDQHRTGMVAKERNLLPALLKGLLGAARIIKLYPLKSKAVSSAIDHLMKTLRGIMKNQSAITLSQASNALLVNGHRVDVTDFKTFAHSFVKYLDHRPQQPHLYGGC